jgi:5-methylcytosine-specific restriction endonuclease McrA
MMSSKLRRRREKLMAADPHCFYCSILVVYFFPPPVVLPDDFATIDHVNSRVRFPARPREGQLVLCCLRCNREKNNRELMELTREERRTRSEHLRRESASLPRSDLASAPLTYRPFARLAEFESYSAARD